MKNKILDMSLRLTIICAVAALILGLVNMVTEPLIASNKAAAQAAALEILSGGEAVGEKSFLDKSDSTHRELLTLLRQHGVIAIDGDIDEYSLIPSYYPVLKEGIADKYILELNGLGYGGKMVILALFGGDGTLIKAKLMDNTETPGLGKKAEQDSYYDKFAYTGSLKEPLPVSKSALAASEAEAVSGSTITFNGIAKALALGSDYVKLLSGGTQ